MDKIKNWVASILVEILPNEYVYHRWSLNHFESRYDFLAMSNGDDEEINRLFEEHFWKYLIWDFFLIIIYLRLWISLEPLIYAFIHFFIMQMLLFNKFLIFSYFIGLSLNITKILFLVGDKNYSEIKKGLGVHTLGNKIDLEIGYLRLFPTYKNAKLCAFWIVSTLQKDLRISYEKWKNTEKNDEINFYLKGHHFWQLTCEYYGINDYRRTPRADDILKNFLKIYESETIKKTEFLIKIFKEKFKKNV
jgi:hypothetical protein